MPETPSTEAMETAQKIIGEIRELTDDGTMTMPSYGPDRIAAIVDAYATERIEELIANDKAVQNIAKGYAAQLRITSDERDAALARIDKYTRAVDDALDEAKATRAKLEATEKLFHDEAATRATAERLLQAAEAKCAEAEAVIKIAIDGADVYKRRYEASTEDWNRTVTVMAENDRLQERVRELEAELEGLREIATSGPSTAAGGSP